MKDESEVEYSRALVPSKNTIYRIIIVILVIVIIALCSSYYYISKNIQNELLEQNGSGDTVSYIINKTENNMQREIGATQMSIDYIDNCAYSLSYPEIGIEEIDTKIYAYTQLLKDNFLNEYICDAEGAHTFSQHIDYKSFIEEDNDMKLVFVETITNDIDIILSNTEYTHYFDLETGEEVDSKRAVIKNTIENVGLEPFTLEDVSNFVLLYSGDVVKFATTALNIRADKDAKSEKIGLLEEGEAIEVRSGDDQWEEVLYEGKTAYVKAGYLSRRKNLHRDVELEILDRGIDPNKPMVAITYDDGPNPKSTPRILDTLEQYGVVATFFDLGQLMNRYPDIVRREEALGCDVGTHTYSHKNLNILSDEEIQEEIKNSEEVFIKVLGHKPTLLRTPYGNVNLKVKENLDYPIIKWNIDSLDWKSRNKNKILSEIRKTNNYDGKIILLHSIYETTADATEILIPELIDRGYQLVTVSELAFYKGHTKLQTAVEYLGFN